MSTFALYTLRSTNTTRVPRSMKPCTQNKTGSTPRRGSRASPTSNHTLSRSQSTFSFTLLNGSETFRVARAATGLGHKYDTKPPFGYLAATNQRHAACESSPVVSRDQSHTSLTTLRSHDHIGPRWLNFPARLGCCTCSPMTSENTSCRRNTGEWPRTSIANQSPLRWRVQRLRCP